MAEKLKAYLEEHRSDCKAVHVVSEQSAVHDIDDGDKESILQNSVFGRKVFGQFFFLL
jgi:hypothetical protein